MGVFSNLARQFSSTNSQGIGMAVEDLVSQAVTQRRGHERRWYDNNFFDDGYHFRVISKKTGRVVDHVNRGSGYVERAIPRASRQIRGVTNLLFAAEPYPVVYPERISEADYPKVLNSQTQKEEPGPEYKAAMERAKDVARKRGMWLSNEWEEQQDLPIKLIDALLLAAKNSISWIQVYSDPDKQRLCTEVFDAFDVIVFGDRRETKDLPFMTKVKPMDFKEVMSNPMFDPKMLATLSPDNKYATSEIKDAYMTARFGSKQTTKDQSTLLVKESFLKEVLTEDNWAQAVKLGEANGAMEGKSKGDMIMRHPFSAGGVTLLDEYVDYDEYPLVPVRFEPGPLYQVPFIERFIPQNKSLDIIVTRLEKWVNAMIVGVYQKRKGENFQVSNFPGGQVVEYETTPLTQMQNGTVGNTPFSVVELLNKFIDEQGATTSTLASLPSGVKSGVAIESVKTAEYANLKIPIMMLKNSIKHIAERMLERAHKDILEPQEYSTIEDGEPQYFDVIGKKGYDLSQKVGKELPEDVTVIDKKVKVRIEIEPGLGLTMEGKRQAMQEIINYMLELNKVNPDFVNPEALKQVIKRFLETFGYGSTQEFMEAMDDASNQGVSDGAIEKMKIAVLEALQEAEEVGPKASEKRVMESQMGAMTALKDTGVAAMANKPEKEESLMDKMSISFKDLSFDAQKQFLAQYGIQINEPTPAAADTAKTLSEIGLNEEDQQLRAQGQQTDAEVKREELNLKKGDLGLKAQGQQSEQELKKGDLNLRAQGQQATQHLAEKQLTSQEKQAKMALSAKAKQAAKPKAKTK
jgi:hypothetical protein